MHASALLLQHRIRHCLSIAHVLTMRLCSVAVLLLQQNRRSGMHGQSRKRTNPAKAAPLSHFPPHTSNQSLTHSLTRTHSHKSHLHRNHTHLCITSLPLSFPSPLPPPLLSRFALFASLVSHGARCLSEQIPSNKQHHFAISKKKVMESESSDDECVLAR